jgi:hypothetical protein
MKTRSWATDGDTGKTILRQASLSLLIYDKTIDILRKRKKKVDKKWPKCHISGG